MKKKINMAGIIFVLLGILIAVTALIAIGFNFENLVDITEATVEINEDFNAIEILASEADVTIMPSSNGKCSITTKCVKGGEIVYSVKDGKLLIEEKEEGYETFGIACNSVILYLTKDVYNWLKISGSSGDTDISGVKFDRAEMNVSSGNIKILSDIFDLSIDIITGNISLKNIKLTTLSIEGSTGDVALENVEIANGASIKASTADVKVLNSKIGSTLSVELRTGELTVENATVGNMHAEAITGDMEFKSLISLGEIKLKATTADIELNGCDASTLNIETSTGEVNGRLLSSKIFYVSTSTGDVSVPMGTEGGICQVKTSTGDVTFIISK